MLTPIRALDGIDLDCQPESAWRVLADVRSYPVWWPAELRLRITSTDVARDPLGTEFEIHPPSARPFRCRVVHAEPPLTLRTQYVSHFLQGTGCWRVERRGEGCRVSYELDVAAHGLLVALLSRVVNLSALHSRGMQGVVAGLRGQVSRSQ